MKKIALSMALLSTLGFTTTFTVSNVSEFRQALEDSALNGEDDTINLQDGVYKTTNDALGTFTYNDEEKYSLTLTSTGKVILDGDNTHRVFSYMNGGGKMMLENIQIQNGNALEALEDGGGIETNAEEVVLDNCIFKNNVANWEGGGIDLSSAEFTIIKNSSFIQNKSQLLWGGGLSSTGTTIVINSTFEENEAPYGSALHSNGYGTFIVNTTFNENIGGGSVSGKGKVINSIFSDNTKDIRAFGDLKIYNNYIDYSKIDSYSHNIIKKNNIHKSIVGDVEYIESTLRLSSSSPVINKGMNIHNDEFKKFLLDKEEISSENLSNEDEKILKVVEELNFDKASNLRSSTDSQPDLGAYEYDANLKPIEDNTSDDQEENNTTSSTGKDDEGGGGGSTGYILPIFVLFVLLYRNRKKKLFE